MNLTWYNNHIINREFLIGFFERIHNKAPKHNAKNIVQDAEIMVLYTYKMAEWFNHLILGDIIMDSQKHSEWLKDQIIGFSLIPVVFIFCCYHTELANILGNILHYFLG